MRYSFEMTGNGQPCTEANIVIRGSNTISDTLDGTPLYVIDGFATEDANPAALNPNDIESIDVLKDAIYGACGANGVIIHIGVSITRTKIGRKNRKSF